MLSEKWVVDNCKASVLFLFRKKEKKKDYFTLPARKVTKELTAILFYDLLRFSAVTPNEIVLFFCLDTKRR